MAAARDVFQDLDDEESRLEAALAGLDAPGWAAPSSCAGWSVKDVVLHLAQTEEGVAAIANGREPRILGLTEVGSVDDLMDKWVRAENDVEPPAVFDRWRTARRSALDALRAADPATPLPWVVAPLRPITLATTRLSEHWIHSLDITGPLGIPHPDTDRIWHIARLAHRTLPYAFGGAGKDAPEVRLSLTAPSGETWDFGDEGAATWIEGDAGDFCRVAGRRLDPHDATHLRWGGPDADEVLKLVRTYA